MYRAFPAGDSLLRVIERLNAFGFDVHRSSGVNYTVLGAIGVKPDFDVRHITVLDDDPLWGLERARHARKLLALRAKEAA